MAVVLNVFMTKSPRKNVPDVGIELGVACIPSELASDPATAPGQNKRWMDELGFYVPSTVFQSIRDDGRVNREGSVQ